MTLLGFLILFPGSILALVALMILGENFPGLIELWKIKLSKGDPKSE